MDLFEFFLLLFLIFFFLLAGDIGFKIIDKKFPASNSADKKKTKFKLLGNEYSGGAIFGKFFISAIIIVFVLKVYISQNDFLNEFKNGNVVFDRNLYLDEELQAKIDSNVISDENYFIDNLLLGERGLTKIYIRNRDSMILGYLPIPTEMLNNHSFSQINHSDKKVRESEKLKVINLNDDDVQKKIDDAKKQAVILDRNYLQLFSEGKDTNIFSHPNLLKKKLIQDAMFEMERILFDLDDTKINFGRQIQKYDLLAHVYTDVALTEFVFVKFEQADTEKYLLKAVEANNEVIERLEKLEVEGFYGNESYRIGLLDWARRDEKLERNYKVKCQLIALKAIKNGKLSDEEIEEYDSTYNMMSILFRKDHPLESCPSIMVFERLRKLRK